jgi:hypothetical protein
MGAEAVIDYKATPDWDQEALKLTAGRGADVIVEVGGAGTLPRSFLAARLGGRIAVIGLLTGPSQVDPMPILRRNLRVQGLYVGSKQMFESMNRAIAAGGLDQSSTSLLPSPRRRTPTGHLKGQSHFGQDRHRALIVLTSCHDDPAFPRTAQWLEAQVAADTSRRWNRRLPWLSPISWQRRG